MLYLDIFNKAYINKTPITGLVIPTDINYLRRLYIFNRDSINNYYKERNFFVKNTNIISRLVEHFPTYLEYNNVEYVDASLNRLTYLAKHFKFTSDIEKGTIHPGYFFGNDNDEIIFSGYDNFDINKAANNWKNIKSIYILKHNKNDTKLLLPLGNNDGSKSGLCSIYINIPKLALQYRLFKKSNELNDRSITKNSFVTKYVLSNTIDDIIDHTLLNRVIDKYYNNTIITPKFKYRFKIFEPITQLNRYVDHTLDVITNKNLDFINILHNIQLIFKLDASELLALPDIAPTNQVKWALLLSRLDYMIFLHDVAKNKTMNKHYLNDWSRLAKRVIRDNLFKDMFPYEDEKIILEKLYIVSNY